MVKNASLSIMIFTYLFAGIDHFTKYGYFLSLVPCFIPHPEKMVYLMGTVEILLAIFLALSTTRIWACYGILLLWSVSLPVNIYVLSIGGAGIPLARWQIAGMIPFHLLLMVWAYWHCSPQGKKRAKEPLPT
jgi:uncharacterized membrane protein